MPTDKPIAYSENGMKPVQASIDVARVDLGASGALLLDQSGRLLVECGSHGDIDVNEFLALLGNAMSASGAVMQLLRDVSAFDLHVHEGAQYEIYATRISDRVFLTLLFSKKEGASRVGMVWLTLRRVVPEVRALLKRAVVKAAAAEDRDTGDAMSASQNQVWSVSEDARKENPRTLRGRDKEPRKRSSAPDPAAAGADDSQRTISYDEARRLGIVDLDDESKK